MSGITIHSAVNTAPPRIAPKLITLYLLVGGVAAACFLLQPAAKISEPGVVMHWPDKVLGFTGTDEPVSDGEKVLLPPDTEFAKKSYVNADGERINSETVLSGIERRSIHRPEICLKGQGWTLHGGQVVPVTLKSGRTLEVMVLDISRPNRLPNGKTTELSALYAYFFVSKDAQTPRHLDRIAITNIDLLFHNKAHRWAYVIAMAPVTKDYLREGKDRAQTLDLIKDFFRESAPTFLKSEQPSPAAKTTIGPNSPAVGT